MSTTTSYGEFFPTFKDKSIQPFNLRSNVVYKFSCGRCNATYYGETCRHLNIRAFKIMASSNSELHLKIKESLLISRDKPELNRNVKSLPLYLFD